MKHAQEPLPPLKERNTRVPANVCAIIERMMAKDPGARYSDYDELIADLERVETGDAGTSRERVPSWTVARAAAAAGRPLWQQPWLWAVGLLAVVAVGLIVSSFGEPPLEVTETAGSSPDAAGGVSAPAGGSAPAVRSAPVSPNSSPQPAVASQGDLGSYTGARSYADEIAEAAEAASAVDSEESVGPDAIDSYAERMAEGLAAVHPIMDMARHSQSLAQLHQLHTQVEVHRAEEGSLPASLEEMSRPHGLSPMALRDAWGRLIVFERLDEESYRLSSLGADGVAGSADDIVLEDGYVVSGATP
jgi:hypothetical protein